jgi:hypothetical protein
MSLSHTNGTFDGSEESEKCGYLETDYDITIGIICAAHFFFGIVYSLFGKWVTSVSFVFSHGIILMTRANKTC